MGVFRPRSATSSILDAYPVRIMLGLVASLSLMLALVHLPLQKTVSRVGWSAQSSANRIVLSDVDSERSSENEPDSEKEATSGGNAPPPTDHRPARPEQPARSASADDPEPEPAQSDSGWISDQDAAQSVAALGIDDQKPRVVGGMGNLYLHINYPEKARQQGIEGQLKLEFTIETDGTVSDIEVIDSLHPLCDSAAVKGVRAVRFVPAKHNGTHVPIRLELPVKFELTAASRTLSQNGPNP
jgi:TonB family protein